MDVGSNVRLEARGVVLFGTLVEQDDLGFVVVDSSDGSRYSVAWESLFDGSVSIEALSDTHETHSLKRAA